MTVGRAKLNHFEKIKIGIKFAKKMFATLKEESFAGRKFRGSR